MLVFQSGAHHWRCLFTQCMNISELICMGNLYLQQIVNIEKFVVHNILSIGITITTYYEFFHEIFNTLHEDYLLFLRGAVNPLEVYGCKH